MIAAAVLAVVGSTSVATAAPSTHTAHLTGQQEVPPAETAAQGQLILRQSPEGASIDYRLIVANIDDVLMAHLHMAPAGANGGVVAWLYPEGPPPQLIPGRTNGTLVTGSITADDLVGGLAGEDLDALVDAIEAGTIYVNVHTPDHPGGEIRGQL